MVVRQAQGALFMLLYEFYLEHNEDPAGFQVGERSDEIYNFEKGQSYSSVKGDVLEWGWGSRLKVGRSVRWLPQELTIYENPN